MRKRLLTNVISLIVVLAVIGGAGYFGYQKFFSLDGHLIKDSGDGISDYSAVFLSNNQIYFGKMYKTKDGSVDLRDIYYLRVDQDLQQGDTKTNTTTNTDANDNSNIVLVKLGEELHGPNDRMVINKDQVLFTESLKGDSKVVEAIKNYKP